MLYKIFFLLVLIIFKFSSALSCEQHGIVEYPIVSDSIEVQIERLVDIGEKEMFLGRFLKADNFFKEALGLCQKNQDQDIRKCRVLFNRAIVLGCLGKEKKDLSSIAALNKVLDTHSCLGPSGRNFFVGDQSILGEDQVSMSECLNRVQNSKDTALAIIGYAPISNKIKLALTGALMVTVEEANRCCRRGGVWKACLQPILEKWWELRMWEKQWKKEVAVEPPFWD